MFMLIIPQVLFAVKLIVIVIFSVLFVIFVQRVLAENEISPEMIKHIGKYYIL